MSCRSSSERTTSTRRALLALAVAVWVCGRGRTSACLAQVAEGQDRAKPAKQERILARVTAFAPSAQDPEGKTGFITIDPENGTWRWILDSKGGGRLSPDGRTLAIREITARRPAIWVVDIERDEPPRLIADVGGVPVWSPDGKQIIFSSSPGINFEPPFETWRMNADGSNRTKLPLDESDLVVDWSRDGQWLLVTTRVRPRDGGDIQSDVHLVHPDGSGRRPLTDGKGQYLAPCFSPDSGRILYAKRIIENERAQETLWVVDLDGQNRRQIPLGTKVNVLSHVYWSPDGGRMAFRVPDIPPGESRIEIVDSDGKTRHVLPLPTGRVTLEGWR